MVGIGRRQLRVLRTSKKLGTKRGKIKAFALVLVFHIIFICQEKYKSLSTWDTHTHARIYI